MDDKDVKKIIKYVRDDLIVRDLLANKANSVAVNRVIELTIHKTVRVISSLGQKSPTSDPGEPGAYQNVTIERRDG